MLLTRKAGMLPASKVRKLCKPYRVRASAVLSGMFSAVAISLNDFFSKKRNVSTLF